MSIWDRIGANRLVWALSVARMGDAIGNSILFVVLPLYVSALPHPLISENEPLLVAILIAVYGFLAAVLQPFVGAFSDWIRRRKILVEIGLAIMGGATLAFTWASHYSDLLWLRIAQGIGVALTVPASMALMTTGTARETRGGSMGIYTTMRMVGFAIGPLLAGYLLDNFGFNLAFYVGSGLIFIGLIAVAALVRDQPPAEETPKFQLFQPGLLSSGILGVGTATFVMSVAFALLVPLEKQFNARTHQTAVGFGLSFTALMISRLILQIPLGRLSDRIGRKPLIISGLVVLAPATAFLATVTSTFSLAGWRVLQGVAAAGIAAPAFAVAADLARGGGEARQVSIATMGFSLGISIGPLLAGWLVVYSFELPFIVAAIMSLAAAIIVYVYVPETVGDRQQTGGSSG